MTAQFGLNQGRVEDITMREDLSQNKEFSLNDFEEGNLGNMEFGMSNLEEPEVARKEAVDETVAATTVTEESGMFDDQTVEKSTLHDSVTQDEQTIRVS